MSSEKLKEHTYFVQGVCGGNIKIGFTSQEPIQRLRNLQTGSPVKLRFVGLIEEDVEKKLQDKFKHLRLHGEWFDNKPELLDYIKSLPIEPLSRVSENRPKNDGLVAIHTVKQYTVLRGGGHEKFPIDFDFVCTDSEDFDDLEQKVCHLIDPGIAESMGMYHSPAWSELDKEEKKLYTDEECYYNYIDEEEPSPNDVMASIMRYVWDVQTSPGHFNKKVNFFNKVCISTEEGCTFFFTNAISSETRRKYIDDLAYLCWKMDEFLAHDFIVYDEDNDECLDLNVIARNKIFSFNQDFRFKPEDIKNTNYVTEGVDK